MLKIKVFDEEHEADLETVVNGFIKKMKTEDIISIHYATSHFAAENREQIYSFSCLLFYKDSSKEK